LEGFLAGIDFGSSNIKVSYCDPRNGRVRRLKIDKDDTSADKKVPNIIAYGSRDICHIGRTVVKTWEVRHPGNVVRQIKRKLELEDWTHEFKQVEPRGEDGAPDVFFTLNAEEIAQDAFRWISRSVGEQGKEIEHAVITVPVCFSEVQKEKIIRSAKAAGIPILDVITEPVAALFSVEELFGEDGWEDGERNVVVADFGGMTLDFCLVRISCREGRMKVQVESSCGIHLGGTDLTEMIYQDIIYPRYRKEIDAEVSQDVLHRLGQEFLDTTEEMKTELFSDEDNTEVEDIFQLPYSSQPLEMTLGLDEALRCFESHRVAERIRETLDGLFEDSAHVEKEDVDMVKLFGGTSRVRYFRELVSSYFGEGVYDPEDYDADDSYCAVADGAARYVNFLLQEDKRMEIKNAIPFCAGVNRDGVFRKVVRRNTKYGVFTPLKSLRTILSPEGEWKISLYQSFTPEPSSIDGEEGAVYLGTIPLDRTLYQDFERILYKFGVDESGRIVGRFFEADEDNETVLREEKEILIGG